MSSGTYHPASEHTGAFTKPSFGGKAKLLGFDKASKAIYTKGGALVKAVEGLNPEAHYEWRCSSLFTGIDSNLGEYIEPIREVVGVVTATLTLIKEVLQAISALTNLTANVLKVLVDKIIDLLAEIVKILNPSIGAHLLLIPPKVGNIGVELDLTANPNDSVINRWAKNSEGARLDFTKWLGDLEGKLPAAINSDVSGLVSKATNTVTGSAYLLSTLKAKLTDKSDLSRPYLCPTSHCGGVGIFLGTNAITQLLAAWNRLNSIFASQLNFPTATPTLPPIPVIVGHRFTELNPLELSSTEAATCPASPSLDALHIKPIRPKTYVNGGLEYTFKERHVYVYDKVSGKANDPAVKLEFVSVVNAALREPDLVYGLLHDRDPLSGYMPGVIHYSTMTVTTDTTVSPLGVTTSFQSPIEFPSWTKIMEGKFTKGHWSLMAVDYYYLAKAPGDTPPYVSLASEVSTFKILDDPEVDAKYLQVAYTNNIKELLDPTGYSPRWLAASSSAVLFPDFVSGVLNLLDNLRVFLHSLLDDALDWLANILDTLSRTLDFLLLISARIDAVLKLLKDIAELNATLGASVVQFWGQGDSVALGKMFTEYLDPTVASTTKDAALLASGGTEKTYVTSMVTDPKAYTKSVAAFKEDIGVLVRSEPDPVLDNVGSVLDVESKKEIVRNTALKNLREGTPPAVSSLSGVLNTSYNMSPVFTKDMTTCGLVLLAHSPTYGRVQLFINLLKFLFGEGEAPSDKTEADSLKEEGLLTDTENLFPQQTTAVGVLPKALFTEDMKLTDDPTQSPFDFCP